MTSFGPTPLRDDQSYRSLSLNETNFLRSCLSSTSTNQFRHDGRHINESRPIKMEFHRAHGHASTTIQFGHSTKVMASISCDIVVPPHPLDRPNDGVFAFQIELSPMAKIGWESPEGSSTEAKTRISNVSDEGQRLTTNRIQRCLERTILNGGVLDTEALCVSSGEWVWKIVLHVTVLEYGGNLVDAAGLASLAALRHFRLPCTQVSENHGVDILHSDDREATPLPLHYTPVFCSFALFHPSDKNNPTSFSEKVTPLLDPNDREEMIAECPSLTFAFNKHEELCCLDFPGGVELSSTQLMQCANKAKQKAKELCSVLEDALKQANEKATQDRMERIRAIDAPTFSENHTPVTGVAFHETSQGLTELEDMNQDVNDTIVEDAMNTASEIVKQSQEEEQYRLRALDYTVGHVAAKVKDDTKSASATNSNHSKSAQKGNSSGSASSLMQAMLQSASISLPPPPKQTLSSTTVSPPIIPMQIPAGFPPKHPSLRSQEDNDEFENFVQQNSAEAKSSLINSKDATMKPINVENDSDEEEEVMVLQGEFSSSQTKESASMVESENVEDDDDNEKMNDLSVAIKKKKKKKSNGSKRRK